MRKGGIVVQDFGAKCCDRRTKVQQKHCRHCLPDLGIPPLLWLSRDRLREMPSM